MRRYDVIISLDTSKILHEILLKSFESILDETWTNFLRKRTESFTIISSLWIIIVVYKDPFGTVPVPWRPCRVSRCPAAASRTSTRRAACHRCRRAVGWARWVWAWAWRWALARARVFSNATTVIRAASPVRRATNPFTSDTGHGPRAAPLSRTTPRAWTSIIRTPARPVSVYRTHCTRCLHFSRRTATTDNTLSSFPVMDYTLLLRLPKALFLLLRPLSAFFFPASLSPNRVLGGFSFFSFILHYGFPLWLAKVFLSFFFFLLSLVDRTWSVANRVNFDFDKSLSYGAWCFFSHKILDFFMVFFEHSQEIFFYNGTYLFEFEKILLRVVTQVKQLCI